MEEFDTSCYIDWFYLDKCEYLRLVIERRAYHELLSKYPYITKIESFQLSFSEENDFDVRLAGTQCLKY
jgi:hypothetical protein